MLVGIIVLVFSMVSGQSTGFRATQMIGMIVGAAAVVIGLRWRRRLRTTLGHGT
jgi:hypothetical protein